MPSPHEQRPVPTSRSTPQMPSSCHDEPWAFASAPEARRIRGQASRHVWSHVILLRNAQVSIASGARPTTRHPRTASSSASRLEAVPRELHGQCDAASTCRRTPPRTRRSNPRLHSLGLRAALPRRSARSGQRRGHSSLLPARIRTDACRVGPSRRATTRRLGIALPSTASNPAHASTSDDPRPDVPPWPRAATRAAPTVPFECPDEPMAR
jgi:hypothetical protein